MIVTGIFCLCVFSLGCLFFCPPFFGAMIIKYGKERRRNFYDEDVPAWWRNLTIIVTIFSTVLAYYPLFVNNSYYDGKLYEMVIAFVILLVYAIVSFFLLKYLPCHEAQEDRTEEEKTVSINLSIQRREDVQEDTLKEKTVDLEKEYNWKTKKTKWHYLNHDYATFHTYCSVAFDDSGKTFYYRTRNPELKVGDFVYVPVGYKYRKNIGCIVAIKKYAATEVPYPLEKTKYIIGKVNTERLKGEKDEF